MSLSSITKKWCTQWWYCTHIYFYEITWFLLNLPQIIHKSYLILYWVLNWYIHHCSTMSVGHIQTSKHGNRCMFVVFHVYEVMLLLIFYFLLNRTQFSIRNPYNTGCNNIYKVSVILRCIFLYVIRVVYCIHHSSIVILLWYSYTFHLFLFLQLWFKIVALFCMIIIYRPVFFNPSQFPFFTCLHFPLDHWCKNVVMILYFLILCWLVRWFWELKYHYVKNTSSFGILNLLKSMLNWSAFDVIGSCFSNYGIDNLTSCYCHHLF